MLGQKNGNCYLSLDFYLIHVTCVPHRDHHHACDDDVDGEGCDHLNHCAPESDLVLLDGEVTLVPVGEGGRIVHILQNVKEFFCELTSALESWRC